MSDKKNYLDKAVRVLEKFGIKLLEGEESRLVTLLEDVRPVDEPKVLAIAQTVRYIGTFNDLMRDNVGEMEVADRYDDITKRFDSIIADSKALVDQMADGKIDLGEKIRNVWMRISRGTTHDRFKQIKDIYTEVQKDTKDQLDKETTIFNAYMDYRFAVQDATALAYSVLKEQDKNLKSSLDGLEKAAKALEGAKGADPEKQTKMRLARDEANRAYQTENRRYQLIKDVAENLEMGHHIADTLMMKLKQTHDVKEAVYRRSVTFFETNETVFTTLDALFTSQKGLNETSQTQKAMIDGANKGLEAIADLSRDFEKAALQAGYGATFNANSVQKLIDSVVNYQSESVKLIAQYRKEATDNVRVIGEKTEEAKQKLTQTVTRYLAAPQSE